MHRCPLPGKSHVGADRRLLADSTPSERDPEWPFRVGIEGRAYALVHKWETNILFASLPRLRTPVESADASRAAIDPPDGKQRLTRRLVHRCRGSYRLGPSHTRHSAGSRPFLACNADIGAVACTMGNPGP